MSNLTPDGLRMVAEVASRHGVSLEAAFAVLDSLALSNGTQAQFNHPDLGGMGQWSRGGMIMIGDMFNQGLKHRVDELCNELASLVRDQRSIHGDPVGRSRRARAGSVCSPRDRVRRAVGGRRNWASPRRSGRRTKCDTHISRRLAALRF